MNEIFTHMGSKRQIDIGSHNNYQAFDIQQLIGTFCKWYQQTLEQKGLFLSTRINRELPKMCEGDPLLIGDLLYDLATYSLDYLTEGCVVLDVDGEDFEEDWYRFYFIITASGPGIPRKHVNNLFQAPSSNGLRHDERNYSSNLYFAKFIAMIFDGDVCVQNNYGFGTRYLIEFCLPISYR
jgi:K+-sensing histidine kinase KdpD